MKNMVLYVSFIICMVSYASALECYVCNSAFHKGCSQNPPPNKYITKCSLTTKQPLMPPNGTEELSTRTKRGTINSLEGVVIEPPPKDDSGYTICRKITITVPDQSNGNLPLKASQTRVFRSCGWIPDQSTSSPCKWAPGEGIQNYMCSCDQDRCNTAGSLNASKTSVVLFTFISSFLIWATS